MRSDGALARALDGPTIPSGLMHDLQRLYDENPGAMQMFAGAIANPAHTQTVSLCFHGGRLQYGEYKITAK